MFNNKLVYIIILVWKNQADVSACLNSINKINYDNYKIVIVNNDEKDLTENIIKNYRDKIIIINNNKNLGFAAGCNQGIQRANKDKADYILLLNGDTIVKDNFLLYLIFYVEKNKKTIVSPAIYFYKKNKIQCLGGKLILWLGITKLIKTKNISPDFLSGACLFVKTNYFKHIGLFDENYFAYFEDADWSLRAKQIGYKLKIMPKSIIWHKSSTSTKTKNSWGPMKFYLLARNNIYFARKNFKGIKKNLWIINYLFLGSNIHLILFCRNIESLLIHYRGIWHGLYKITIKNDYE